MYYIAYIMYTYIRAQDPRTQARWHKPHQTSSLWGSQTQAQHTSVPKDQAQTSMPPPDLLHPGLRDPTPTVQADQGPRPGNQDPAKPATSGAHRPSTHIPLTHMTCLTSSFANVCCSLAQSSLPTVPVPTAACCSLARPNMPPSRCWCELPGVVA